VGNTWWDMKIKGGEWQWVEDGNGMFLMVRDGFEVVRDVGEFLRFKFS
jgi:hypothetical protein